MSKELAKTTPGQISHSVGYLDEQFIAAYEDEVSLFGAKSREFAELTLRIGLRLEFVKSQLKHGQLNKWIAEHGGLSTSHAHRCRQLAKVFIKAQQIGADEMAALVDPENSKEALIKKLEQMAFDFIGDKTQAELFAEHGIALRDAKKKGGDQGGGKARANMSQEEVEEGITKAIRTNWKEAAAYLNSDGLEEMTWARLERSEIQGLQALCEALAQKMSKHLNKRAH